MRRICCVGRNHAAHAREMAIAWTVSPFYFQEGDVRQMIWTVAKIITHLSASFSLALRELISSSTPVGVGPGERGDRLCRAIEGVGKPNLQVD